MSPAHPAQSGGTGRHKDGCHGPGFSIRSRPALTGRRGVQEMS